MWCFKSNPYTFKKAIGRGSYASVYEAVSDGESYAIKMSRLQSPSDTLRCYREVEILNFLKSENCSSCITIRDGWIEGDVAHTVMPLFEASLNDIEVEHLTEVHTRYIMYQIFLGLTFLHSAGICHRDIKPSNVLVESSDCKTVLCDFNMAKPLTSKNFGIAAYDITSMWYRAPELLEHKEYDERIDVWSAGCVAATISKFTMWNLLTEAEILEDIKIRWKHDLLPSKGSLFGDFLRYVLQPRETRPSALEVLDHPWFEPVRSSFEIKLASCQFTLVLPPVLSRQSISHSLSSPRQKTVDL